MRPLAAVPFMNTEHSIQYGSIFVLVFEPTLPKEKR